MRLDRLEISGFKSFSDRSELAFDKGVTAIVGPNGCGKSNVADAITWVMGEQSAKSLRGDRMEDVIFNGSDARKPTATAEVRLRFAGVLKSVTGPAFADAANGQPAANGRGHADGNGGANGYGADARDAERHGEAGEEPHGNGHGTVVAPEEIIQSVAREVEVTRRLYRSGESEYLIDGQVCRLRDIHDLLMDTGLGAKAYAIIEQGKIGMILSSRPTDRRQLIEEAAGVTKYKARRRAAELKLEAAQQNLTRIDDIVFEVEKQRAALKRQAGRARRYQRLREELHRWEKVLYARKYRQLAEVIGSARTRLADARAREAAAAAAVAELDARIGRARLELVEAETAATVAREEAHAHELEINRRQQQIAFDQEQVQTLLARTDAVVAELESVGSRLDPARAAVMVRRAAALEAEAERARAGLALAAASDAYEAAHREIEGLEADVEAARSEVFSAINAATALRHSLEHAAAARERVAETLSKLQVEGDDVRIELERVETDRTAAADGLRRVEAIIETTRVLRTAHDSELAAARVEHEWRARAVRAGEQQLAAIEARLKSLEELEAGRAEYGDAARTVLAAGNGRVNQRGAVADYLEVEVGYERAVEACLGDLLQHVIVEQPQHAAAGLTLVRRQNAGRCGFLISSLAPAERGTSPDAPASTPGTSPPAGLVPLSAVVRVNGPFDQPIRQAMGEALIAPSYERAEEVSRETALSVATIEGDLFRGAHLVSGGTGDRARSILETKRDIKTLRSRAQAEREALQRLGDETAALETSIAQASSAINRLDAELHGHDKAIVGLEAQLQRVDNEAVRLNHKREQLARERRQAEEERSALLSREEEGRRSIARLEEAQVAADGRLTNAQRRLFEAREAADALQRQAADAGATHAALLERAAGLGAELERLEEASRELDSRAEGLATERDELKRRVEDLRAAIAAGSGLLDDCVRRLDTAREAMRGADEAVMCLRAAAEEQEGALKTARVSFEAIRGTVAELDVARATAESDLAHLAESALGAVQAGLDEILEEVAALERDGRVTPDAGIICRDESDEGEELVAPDPAPGGPTPAGHDDRHLTAEEAISHLRAKIDRLGPVNMMAIEQFDELEERHTFLTTQRKDLVDSIAQTCQAIKRIDETTRKRFSDAFVAINRYFHETFGMLFGGGRAGLTLLDDMDPLESGLEVVAQPPGKRLQSVQLLSGGEKALTAIALMFALFKYKPSPFCLLDEIDAPLDDANIGRFVELLRCMQQQTQFILITHNRKTMEIADRLYGVTMEEPGVSKLVSVQVN